jgi:molecular chaperone IbpA
MNYRNDDFYPPRPEKDWNMVRPKIREPKVPQSPYTSEHVKTNPPLFNKPLTIADLFPRIDRWGIGLLDELNNLKLIADSKPSYPPYNIRKHKSGKWDIEIAIAGFRKDEVEVTVKDRTLTVASTVEIDEEADTFGEVVHHGIAQRNFTLNFVMAEYVEVENATMADGILTINLVTNIPDEKKPKVIDIK